MTLKFSSGNRKLHELAVYNGLNKNQIYSFDLPAGYTCPMAVDCKTYSDKITGKITDGKDSKFRCYASSGEARFTATRKLHWHNFDALRGLNIDAMVELIQASIPNKTKIIRIHSSGDFFSFDYFIAWWNIAKSNPDITFFGYTKILPYVGYPKSDNFRLIYSYGGKMDALISDEPVAYVVNTVSDAYKKALQVVCQNNPADDFDMIMQGRTFALALHGTQPAKR